MIELLKSREARIAEICQSLGIRRLEVFGSAANGDFDPATSDIDFIVVFGEAKPGESLLDRYLLAAEQLEQTLGRHVDLITPASIRNRYFRHKVEASKELVYAG